jgi:hypothetical protein
MVLEKGRKNRGTHTTTTQTLAGTAFRVGREMASVSKQQLCVLIRAV